MNYVREDIAVAWRGLDPLAQAFALQGEPFREVPGRRTLKVDIAGKSYFVKLHYGVGWQEIFKNWLQLKRPVVGAVNEYLACTGLHEEGITAPVPAAFAEGAGSIAERKSFVLCDELRGYTSLEDVTDGWDAAPPDSFTRHRLLYAVARFARRFHQAGFIHRDFYICHLLANDEDYAGGVISLAVLDLHRARRFARIPRRWLLRDLAALLFSSLDLGYTRNDWLRFVRIYTGEPIARMDVKFWQQVLERAERLYEEGLRKDIVKGRYKR